jgi:hypothetical protein
VLAAGCRPTPKPPRDATALEAGAKTAQRADVGAAVAQALVQARQSADRGSEGGLCFAAAAASGAARAPCAAVAHHTCARYRRPRREVVTEIVSRAPRRRVLAVELDRAAGAGHRRLTREVNFIWLAVCNRDTRSGWRHAT